jgi:hypothetical protein
MKKNHILKVAMLLNKKGKTWTFAQLARSLNMSGFRTNRGTLYVVGGRGIAKLVSTVWHEFDNMGLVAESDEIVNAFTNQWGNFAY